MYGHVGLWTLLPHLHLAPPLWVTPFDFAEIFGVRKLESLGYRVVFLT